MTDDYIPLLTRLSPNSGAYANEVRLSFSPLPFSHSISTSPFP